MTEDKTAMKIQTLKKSGLALKSFMKNNFDFGTFKKCGLYPKDLKHNDYEGQAAIICNRLGLENIYDYGKYEIRCHISYCTDKIGMSAADLAMMVDDRGKLKVPEFVETIFENQMHLTGEDVIALPPKKNDDTDDEDEEDDNMSVAPPKSPLTLTSK